MTADLYEVSIMVSILLILSLFSSPAFATTADEFRLKCQQLLTSNKAALWAGEEIDWRAQQPTRELKFFTEDIRLTNLQKAALGIEPDAEVANDDLTIYVTQSREKIRIQTFKGGDELGAVDFDWQTVRTGYRDYSLYKTSKIKLSRAPIRNEIHSSTYFLLSKKMGGINVGLGFQTFKSEERISDDGSKFELVIVRRCVNVFGEEGDVLFPMRNADPRAKNYCLVPIGTISLPKLPPGSRISWKIGG